MRNIIYHEEATVWIFLEFTKLVRFYFFLYVLRTVIVVKNCCQKSQMKECFGHFLSYIDLFQKKSTYTAGNKCSNFKAMKYGTFLH